MWWISECLARNIFKLSSYGWCLVSDGIGIHTLIRKLNPALGDYISYSINIVCALWTWIKEAGNYNCVSLPYNPIQFSELLPNVIRPPGLHYWLTTRWRERSTSLLMAHKLPYYNPSSAKAWVFRGNTWIQMPRLFVARYCCAIHDAVGMAAVPHAYRFAMKLNHHLSFKQPASAIRIVSIWYVESHTKRYTRFHGNIM